MQRNVLFLVMIYRTALLLLHPFHSTMDSLSLTNYLFCSPADLISAVDSETD